MVLLPAAWLLTNAVPLLLVLAYASLAHAHRTHELVVQRAWRAHIWAAALTAGTFLIWQVVQRAWRAHIGLLLFVVVALSLGVQVCRDRGLLMISASFFHSFTYIHTYIGRRALFLSFLQHAPARASCGGPVETLPQGYSEYDSEYYEGAAAPR
jgi:hypothetical protein